MPLEFFGLDLDEASRCRHYHTHLDIVAIKCATCRKFYACYHCHDALESHSFAPTDTTENRPVLCGSCRQTLTRVAYQKGTCPYCQAPFNPKCHKHTAIYFKGDLLYD